MYYTLWNWKSLIFIFSFLLIGVLKICFYSFCILFKNLINYCFLLFQNYSKESIQKPGAPPPHTTLQRHTKANRNVFIPRYVCLQIPIKLIIKFCLLLIFFRFYYPFGKPESQQQWETIVNAITDYFLSLPNSQASKHHFGQIAKVKYSEREGIFMLLQSTYELQLCNCPLYWKQPLFFACGGDVSSTIDLNTFLSYWKE